MTAFSDAMLVPALILALMAWVVPKLLSMVLPEGVAALLINAFLSTLVLFTASSAFFVVLYVAQGAGAADLAQFGWGENAVFFGRLGLTAGIIWGPILVLAVANLPRYWTKAVW